MIFNKLTLLFVRKCEMQIMYVFTNIARNLHGGDVLYNAHMLLNTLYCRQSDSASGKSLLFPG